MEARYSFSDRVLRDMSSAVLVLDKKGGIVYMNGPASELFEVNEGYREEGSRFSLISESGYNDAFNEAVFQALYNKEETVVEKVPYMAPSGKKYVVLMSCSFLEVPDTEDAQLVITLKNETEAEQLKQKFDDSSKTFTAFLFSFGIWMLLYALWEFLGRPIPETYMTQGVELMGINMFFYILRNTSLTWSDLGVVTKKPKTTILTALVVAVCCVAFLCAVKAVARMIDPTCFRPDAPFIDFSRFGFSQIIYILTAGIQEFLARSVMQGNLKRIVVSKHPTAMAILLSSLIFAALHVHYGFIFMMGAAILAALGGILYEKQQNIFGVWIVHWVFGVSATLLGIIGH